MCVNYIWGDFHTRLYTNKKSTVWPRSREAILQRVSLANSHVTPGAWAALRLWEPVQNPWIKICHSHISGFHIWMYRRGMVAHCHVITWRFYVVCVKPSHYFAIVKGSLSHNSEIIFMLFHNESKLNDTRQAKARLDRLLKCLQLNWHASHWVPATSPWLQMWIRGWSLWMKLLLIEQKTLD